MRVAVAQCLDYLYENFPGIFFREVAFSIKSIEEFSSLTETACLKDYSVTRKTFWSSSKVS